MSTMGYIMGDSLHLDFIVSHTDILQFWGMKFEEIFSAFVTQLWAAYVVRNRWYYTGRGDGVRGMGFLLAF